MELLNKLTPAGLPPHHLNIEKDMVLMLLGILLAKQRLYNSTRLILIYATNILLCCKIDSGDNAREQALIPSIEIKHQDEQFIEWNRRQFPVWPAFAMTINKCQGQTLRKWESGWRSLHSLLGSSMSRPQW